VRADASREQAESDGFDTLELEGDSGAEIAAEIEQLRTRLAGPPEHIVITTSDDPAIAMPAASWAARSGDPVLYVSADGVPAETREVLERHDDVPIYVLGDQDAIPSEVVRELGQIGASVNRVGASDPVSNAIEFARYTSGSFGWNINDPGHGLVIAHSSRPLDAAAAAPLSASGTWGPLLVLSDAASLPDSLRGYLLDLKPGYETDPTRAVYNHVWVIGDPEAVSVEVQAQIDELAEVAPVRSGAG
jgi:putative cell wall-binding protein